MVKVAHETTDEECLLQCRLKNNKASANQVSFISVDILQATVAYNTCTAKYYIWYM